MVAGPGRVKIQANICPLPYYAHGVRVFRPPTRRGRRLAPPPPSPAAPHVDKPVNPRMMAKGAASAHGTRRPLATRAEAVRRPWRRANQLSGAGSP